MLAVGRRGDLLDDHRLGRFGWPQDNAGLAGLDEKGEHGSKLAGAQRVVHGDGGRLGHGRAPNGGEEARMPSPDIRPSPNPKRRSTPFPMAACCRRGMTVNLAPPPVSLSDVARSTGAVEPGGGADCPFAVAELLAKLHPKPPEDVPAVVAVGDGPCPPGVTKCGGHRSGKMVI